MSQFVTAGPVPTDSTAYVHRAFEDQIFTHLTSAQAHWVLMLGPRQHGKSTALRRIAAQLDESGVRVAILDMQAYAADSEYAHLLAWLAAVVAAGVGAPPPVPPANSEDLEGWLTRALSTVVGAVSIFIDEASALPDSQRRRLWSQLRALYTARGSAGKPSVIAKLSFCFAGTFRPEKLIDNDNSPFNISEDVPSTDLTLEEARALAQAGGANAGDVVVRAFDLVGGQPYLLQSILKAADDAGHDYDATTVLASAARRLRSGDDRHMTALFERVLDDLDAQAAVAAMIAEGGTVPFESLNVAHRWLQTLGVAKTDDQGGLTFRNRLYADFAAGAPQLSPAPAPTPIAPSSTAAAHVASPGQQSLLHVPSEAFDGVPDIALRELAQANAAGGSDAFNAGHNRLALVATGAALESVLLAHLESLSPADRTAARTAAQAAHVGPPLNCSGAPSNWNLKAMVSVAHETTALSGMSGPITDAVRDWRNQIHPHVARSSGLSDAQLQPEVFMAAGALTGVLRSLKSANAPAPTAGIASPSPPSAPGT